MATLGRARQTRKMLSLSLSLCSTIFSPFYPTFFHNRLSTLVSDDPGVCLAAAPLIYEWLSQTYSLGKVSTWPPFMTFAFSICFKCLLLNARRREGKQAAAVSNWILNGLPPPTQHSHAHTIKHAPISMCHFATANKGGLHLIVFSALHKQPCCSAYGPAGGGSNRRSRMVAVATKGSSNVFSLPPQVK